MSVQLPPEDDWFGAEQWPARAGDELPVEEDWLVEAEGEPASRPRFWPSQLGTRRVLVAVGLLVVFLLALLAATGVFSSGGHPPAQPPATTTTGTTVTTTTTATTTTSPRILPLPSATLKPGATGSQVKLLQRALAALGYSAGAVDGDYGPATQRAVAAFQRAHQLVADGIAGAITLRALARARAK
jgi:hypothetical protein